MASSSIPPHAQAVINKCEICDHGNDARWYCKDCDEEMCKDCKIIHLRSKQSRSHDVISIAADTETPQECQGHKNILFCSSHPKEPVQMYCINCEEPVCVTCITDKKHKTHSFDKLTNVLDQYKEKLASSMDTVKQQIVCLQSTLQSVQENEVTYSSQSDDTIDEINKQRQELKSQIDNAADNHVQEAKEHQTKDLQEIQQQVKDLTQVMSNRKDLLTTIENKLQAENDVSIIWFVAEVRKQLEDTMSFQTTYICPPKFTSGESIDLQEEFGHLQPGRKEKRVVANISVSKSSDEQADKKPIESHAPPTIDASIVANINPGIKCACVSAVNGRLAWCGHGLGLGCYVTLTDIDGQVLKKVKLDFTLGDIAITSKGELLIISDYNLMKNTKDGKFRKIADLSPSYTKGLTVTSNNDILVCVISDGDKVIRLTDTGQITQTIQKDKLGKPLFNNPQLVTENINQDICIVHGRKRSVLVVLNKDGELRYRYPQNATSENSISKCYGIVCDNYGFILISDTDKCRIHQIDRDGRFVQYVLTQQHGIWKPWGLSTDDKGQLWVCDQDQKNNFMLKVIKYRS